MTYEEQGAGAERLRSLIRELNVAFANLDLSIDDKQLIEAFSVVRQWAAPAGQRWEREDFARVGAIAVAALSAYSDGLDMGLRQASPERCIREHPDAAMHVLWGKNGPFTICEHAPPHREKVT